MFICLKGIIKTLQTTSHLTDVDKLATQPRGTSLQGISSGSYLCHGTPLEIN